MRVDLAASFRVGTPSIRVDDRRVGARGVDGVVQPGVDVAAGADHEVARRQRADVVGRDLVVVRVGVRGEDLGDAGVAPGHVAGEPFPMTSRALLVAGVATPANDLGHIALTAVTVLLMVGMIVAAAVPFSTVFRVYSAVSALTVLVFGALTGVQAPKLAAGAPTPWMGVSERVSIGAWLLWMAVLAVLLLAGSRGRD